MQSRHSNKETRSVSPPQAEKTAGFFMFNENMLFDNTFESALSRRPRQLLSLLTNKTKQTVHLKADNIPINASVS